MAESTGFLEVDGGRLYYEMTGDGPAVVLGHAGIADLRMWDQQVEPFSEHYTVVRFDVRGFGRSPFGELEWAPHDDIARLLDQLGIDKVAVVAVSMSGGIAVDFAIAHPDRIWALVPVGSAIDGFDYAQDEQMMKGDAEEQRLLEAGDTEGATQLMVRLWVAGPNRSVDDVDAAVCERIADMQRAIYESGRNPTQNATELEPLAITHLEDISAPTLVIVGEEDFDCIKGVADLLASRIPGAEKVVMQNTAHVPNMERPDEFNRLVLDFLAKHAPAS